MNSRPCFLLTTWTRYFYLQINTHHTHIKRRERDSLILDCGLTISFGIQYLYAAHWAYALLVGTLLTIVGIFLMYYLLADATLLKLSSVRVVAGLARCQCFVLVDRSSSALCGITCAVFPSVWRDHFAQLLLTLLTDHLCYIRKKSRLFFCWN